MPVCSHYEWIQKDDGVLTKRDAVTHGEHHFFPGPCDAAWDLAGAAVEWDLYPHALDYLLLRFRALSGIDARKPIQVFMLAYAAFRMAFCKMASGSVPGKADEFPLRRAYGSYRRRVEHCLLRAAVAKSLTGGPRVRFRCRNGYDCGSAGRQRGDSQERTSNSPSDPRSVVGAPRAGNGPRLIHAFDTPLKSHRQRKK
jgi:hypothetical protein